MTRGYAWRNIYIESEEGLPKQKRIGEKGCLLQVPFLAVYGKNIFRKKWLTEKCIGDTVNYISNEPMSKEERIQEKGQGSDKA